MNLHLTRIGLYLERFGTSFAMGLFFVLPLYFKGLGWDETFFGQVYAIGVIGTLLSVVLSSWLIRQFGFGKIAPIGSLLYTMGCLLYLVLDHAHHILGYYIASFLQSAGWGLVFTMGPIGIASTLSDQNSAERARYFTVHFAYTALGAGSAPFVMRYCETYFSWTTANFFLLGTVTAMLSYLIAASVAWNNAAYKTVKPDNLSIRSEFTVVLRQPSVYFFAMIFLSGCIYTTVMSLQMTFAALKKIDYVVFYGFYSLGTILPQFLFSKKFAQIATQKSIPCLVFISTMGTGFLLVAANSPFYYALSALLLGAGYGSAYSLVQSEAVCYVKPNLRPSVLVYFSLSNFLSVYLFPYFASLIATIFSYDILWVVLIGIGFLYFLMAIYFYWKVCPKLGQAFVHSK